MPIERVASGPVFPSQQQQPPVHTCPRHQWGCAGARRQWMSESLLKLLHRSHVEDVGRPKVVEVVSTHSTVKEISDKTVIED